MELKYPKDKYPRISVITVVYNRVGMIERAIQSAISQNYPNMEYMVLDAASTDGTVEIINKYRDKIDYFRSHKDSGPANAINEGIDNSTGEIIALLNSDDFFEPNILIKVGEAFIENPDVEMVNFKGRVVEILPSGEIKELDVFPSNMEDLDLKKDRVNPPFTLVRFYKKNLFNKYGKFLEETNGKKLLANDSEYFTRLGIYGVKTTSINFLGYSVRAHEGSISFNNNKYNKLIFHDEKVSYLEHLLKAYEADISSIFKAILLKEYAKAYPRRITKNFVDRDFKLLKINLKLGLEEFGPIIIWRSVRFYISYILRK